MAMLLVLVSVISVSSETLAQTSAPAADALTTSAEAAPDPLKLTHLFFSIGGFIPVNESYRLNYGASLGGLPIEVAGGLMFPVSRDLLVPITLRYERRAAKFIDQATVRTVSLEPGVRWYLEKERPHDLRIFGGGFLVLAQSTASGSYDVSSDGAVYSSAIASKIHSNIGLAFDLGLSYPLAPESAVDATVHTASFFSDASQTGGLGNVGGVSITLGYRTAF